MKNKFPAFVLFVLYGAVGYLSLGYDDEFFNIRLIEKLGFEVIGFLQTTDIHPPGSYFIDYILFETLGKWELVRLVISLFTASTLIYAVVSVRNRHGEFAAFVSFLLLGLNPAVLLWCTSIRWYAFFVPVLIWLSIVPRKQGWTYWAKCFGGLLCLGYLGYAVFIVAIPIISLYWNESAEKSRKKMRNIFQYGFLFLILYSYQLYIFLTVHIKGLDSQVSSLLKSLFGFYAAQVSNQGVFPLAVPGFLTGIGTLGIVITILYSDLNVNLKNKYFVSYSLAAIFTIVTGVASKVRNLVIISPWQAFWISTAKVEASQKKFFLFFLIFLATGNLWGDYNIVTHQNTIKSNYNMPVKQILEDLNMEKMKSGNDLVILCHDPKLSWHLEKAGYQLLGPYSHHVSPAALLSKHHCVILLKTWAGVGKKRYRRMYEEIKFLNCKSSVSVKYGRDDFYVIKNKLNALYPEYMVEVTKYYDVDNLAALKSWLPVKKKLLGY